MSNVIELPNGVRIEFLSKPADAHAVDSTAKQLEMDTPPDVGTPVSEDNVPVSGRHDFAFTPGKKSISPTEELSPTLRNRVLPHSRVVIDYAIYAPMLANELSAPRAIIEQVASDSKQSSISSDSFGSTKSPTEDAPFASSVRHDRRVPLAADALTIESKLVAIKATAIRHITDAISEVSAGATEAQCAPYTRDPPSNLGDELEVDFMRGPLEEGVDVELLVEDPRDGPQACSIIPGLNDTLLHMFQGERVMAFIPAYLSYASTPCTAKIPKQLGGHPETQNTLLLTTVGKSIPRAETSYDPLWPEACTALLHSLCRREGVPREDPLVASVLGELIKKARFEETRFRSSFSQNKSGASNVFLQVTVKSVIPEEDLSRASGSRYITKHTMTRGSGAPVSFGDEADFFIVEESAIGEPQVRSVLNFTVGGPDSCDELDTMLASMLVGEEARFKVGSVAYQVQMVSSVSAGQLVGAQAIKLAMQWKDRGNAALNSFLELDKMRLSAVGAASPKIADVLPQDALKSPFVGHVGSGDEINFRAHTNEGVVNGHRAYQDSSKRNSDSRSQWSVVCAGHFGRRAGCVVGAHGRCRIMDVLSTYLVQPPRQPRAFESDRRWGPPALPPTGLRIQTPVRSGSPSGASPMTPATGRMEDISVGGSDFEGSSPLLVRLSQHNSSEFPRAYSMGRETSSEGTLPPTVAEVDSIHGVNEEAALLNVLQQYEHGIHVLLDEYRFGFSVEDVPTIEAAVKESPEVADIAKQRLQGIRDLCSNSSQIFLQLRRYDQAEAFATHSIASELKLTKLAGSDQLESSQAQKAFFRRLKARIQMGRTDLALGDAAEIKRILEARSAKGEDVRRDLQDVIEEEKKLIVG